MAKFCRVPLNGRTLPSNGKPGMLQDIQETPGVLRRMLATHLKGGRAELPAMREPLQKSSSLKGKTPLEVMVNCSASSGSYGNKFVVVGSGSSYNAALLAEYLIETVVRIPVEVQYASEYRYRTPLLSAGDVFVVVSASGETSDGVECLRAVRRSKNGGEVMIVGVVNQMDSTIARESDVTILVEAGEENGIAATKAFSATTLAFLLLAIMLGEACGTLDDEARLKLVEQLQELPAQVEKVLQDETRPWTESEPDECVLWDISRHNVLAQNFIFLGRGLNFPVALEGAMKCKELAYIHAEGYPAAEMKHGPIALIDQFMPVVVIAPRSDPTFLKIKANIEEVKARHGSVICITDAPSEDLGDLCEHVLRVPPTHEYLFPLLSVIPLQLLAYMMGILRGNEVDNPRNLSKSISIDAVANMAGFRPPERSDAHK